MDNNFTNTESLLSCPFCGSNVLIFGYWLDTFNDLNNGNYVQCKTCLATGGLGETIECAIRAWNNRLGVLIDNLEAESKAN